jgi:hypothetical protein
MIGARQVAGSTISNGGDNSPFNWVIRRASSLVARVLPSGAFLPENRGLCAAILSEIVAVCQVKKTRLPWNASLRHEGRPLIAFRPAPDAVRSHTGGTLGAGGLSPEIYRLQGLVSGVIQ